MSSVGVNREAIARIAASYAGDLSRSRLNRLSARDLDIQTAYKAAGLTAAEVRDLIYAEWERQEQIRAERQARKPKAPPEAGDIFRRAEQRRHNERETEAEFARCRPILEAQQLHGGARVRIGQYLIRAVEEGQWVHDRYSRSWHRMYGGIWEVLDRRVELLRVGRLLELEVVAPISINAFRGHWLIRAIIELLGLEPVPVPRGLRAIQGNPHFEVDYVRSLGPVRIYVRRLAGEPVDYCAVVDGETFHAASPREAVKGLHHKVKLRAEKAAVQAAREREVLTAEDGFALGFCEAGMRDFCSLNGLDFDGAYTRAELRQVIDRRRDENLIYWRQELSRIGLI